MDNVRYIGNTCIKAAGSRAWDFSGVAGGIGTTRGVEVANNVMAVTSGNTSCSSVTSSSGPISLHHNYWISTPTDADCRNPGTGDTYSTFSRLGLPAVDFASADKDNFPSYSDFAISATSDAASGGKTFTEVVMSQSEWTWVLSQRKWLPSCQSTQVPASEWVKVLSTDYCGAPRTVGSYGALNGTEGQGSRFTLIVD